MDENSYKRENKELKKQLAIANKQIELQIGKNKKCKATLTSVNKELGYQNMLLKACLEGPKDIMIFSIDRDFNYLFFNDSHKRGMKCAYEKEVSLGMNFLDQITSEEDKIKVKSNFELSFNGTSHMTLGVHGTLTNKYYETFYCPINGENNEIIGATTFSRDITEKTNGRGFGGE